MTGKLYLNLRSNLREEAKLNIKCGDSITELSVDAKLDCLPYDFQRVLASDYCAYADLSLSCGVDGVLSRVLYNPFWSKPSFERDMSRLADNIQNMLIKQGDKYTAILPLCMSDYNAYISASDEKNTLRIKITKYYEGSKKLCGVFAVLAENSNPYMAVHMAYEYAVNRGYILTPLRENKRLPEIYKKLGWCTWNAFYHDVTEKGIIDKLEEFKSKNVPIKWIIIDDGWSKTAENSNFEISSFFEDRTKFPNGLREFIRHIKENYGIEKVGVWHSLTGYWYGIEKNSDLYERQKNRLTETNSGYIIPSDNGAYDFFNEWHEYLKGQGVDFVKIDTQGNTVEFLKGQRDCVKKAIEIQNAADRSVMNNFDGNVVNCMGLSNINLHNRPYSALVRSSDDFYPDKKGSFKEHLIQNVYNAVFLRNLYYCDFDMWWTANESAADSSALRAISGGPVYVSDKVGDTNGEYLKSLIDENGVIPLFESVAVPTPDCLFGYDKTLKVQNTLNGEVVIKEFTF